MIRLFALALFALCIGCVPPPGFARTPTPAPPTISSAEICADYVRDLRRATTDLQRDLATQVNDLVAVVSSGRPPTADTARRLADRRDDLLRTAVRFERPAPCPEGETGRAPLARAAGIVREATTLANQASDVDDLRLYNQAAAAYRRAYDALV